MKKLNLIIVSCCVLMACKKDYTCTCTTYGDAMYYSFDETIQETRIEDAQARCTENEYHFETSGMVCEITNY